MNQSILSPLKPISEDVCNDIIDAFCEFKNRTRDLANSFSELNNAIWKSELKSAEVKILLHESERIIYSEKLKTSKIFTRWYWRKKLYKSTISLRSYKQMKSYIETLI